MRLEWQNTDTWIEELERAIRSTGLAEAFLETLEAEGGDWVIPTEDMDRLSQRFFGDFSTILMFHAARPRNVQTYYEEGIVAFSNEEEAVGRLDHY